MCIGGLWIYIGVAGGLDKESTTTMAASTMAERKRGDRTKVDGEMNNVSLNINWKKIIHKKDKILLPALDFTFKFRFFIVAIAKFLPHWLWLYAGNVAASSTKTHRITTPLHSIKKAVGLSLIRCRRFWISKVKEMGIPLAGASSSLQFFFFFKWGFMYFKSQYLIGFTWFNFFYYTFD